jgi:DNA polymerase sliding clamp subunit (PCNA homolog)
MIDFSDDDGGGRSRIRFISRLIDGEFPDYQAIIPDAHTTQIGFLKKEILFQLKPAQIFSGKNSEITVEVSVKDKVAKIASRAADFGGYEGETGLLVAEGKDIAIVFNNRFLIDGLSAITADECFLGFSGDDGPALLRSKTGDDFIYIIMPIKKY